MSGELDKLKEINQTFTRNLDKINNLIEKDFLDEAVILIVAILEVLWKDLFKSNKELWFGGSVGGGTIEEEINNRKDIRAYLKSIRVYDDFLRSYYIYQGQAVQADIESIFEALFENNNDKINFQNLTENNGVKKAYKVFFDINLMNLFHGEIVESGKIWTKLTDLFAQRHEIIHAGRNTSILKDELNELLESIKVMENNLFRKFCRHWGILLD